MTRDPERPRPTEAEPRVGGDDDRDVESGRSLLRSFLACERRAFARLIGADRRQRRDRPR